MVLRRLCEVKMKKIIIFSFIILCISVFLTFLFSCTSPVERIRIVEISKDAEKQNEKELLEAYAHPGIVHFVWPKPFWRKQTGYYKEWWDLARLTGFYDEIYNKCPRPFLRFLLNSYN